MKSASKPSPSPSSPPPQKELVSISSAQWSRKDALEISRSLTSYAPSKNTTAAELIEVINISKRAVRFLLDWQEELSDEVKGILNGSKELEEQLGHAASTIDSLVEENSALHTQIAKLEEKLRLSQENRSYGAMESVEFYHKIQNAATVVQRMWRGYITRKKIRRMCMEILRKSGPSSPPVMLSPSSLRGGGGGARRRRELQMEKSLKEMKDANLSEEESIKARMGPSSSSSHRK
eukprot:TRINITY_DN7248_c1_g1_i2.p1 TRINITY_DN7248_c1_g1~~TRINITY_DN7248_c1_g1_i2.p1  ORF type:complete len:235 (-),score=67.72 TRINITY_DN7248_c1_g1_i2:22-726(-)